MIIKSGKISTIVAIVGIATSLMSASVGALDSNQDKFFDSIRAHCGKAFSGSVEDSSNSTAYTGRKFVLHIRAVSYTHLTLPTKRIV